jgi:hypothetical protein
MAIDAQYKTFLCRVSPTGRTTTGVSTGRLQTSHVVVHLRHPRARRSPTTIDAPMKAQMPTPMLHHSSGGHPRTWPRRPCCCAAVRSPQPPWSGTCGSEGTARGCGSSASGKLRLAPALKARAGWSAICPRPEPASSSATGTRGRSQGCGVSSPESSRAPPRRPAHHRGSPTS